METLKTIAARKSIRSFNSEPISNNSIETILRAGNSAPRDRNSQDTLHISVIRNTNLLNAISQAAQVLLEKDIDPLYGAGMLIILSAKNSAEFEHSERFHHINCACIAENMLLAATDMGLGSVITFMPLLAFKHDPDLFSKLNLPKDFRLVLSMIIGQATYPLNDNSELSELTIPLDFID